MKKTLVASMALVAGSALAGSFTLPATESSAKTGSLQSVLDRNAHAYYAEQDWFKRIELSGLVKSDLAVSNRSTVLPGGRSVNRSGNSDLWLSRANLYVDAYVNDWVAVHVAFSTGAFYEASDQSPFIPANAGAFAADVRSAPAGTSAYGQYDEISYRLPSIIGFGMDEAYAIIGNASQTPVYGRVGRLYVRNGDYQRDVNPATLTQLMTQTQADVIELGLVDMSGFNGAAWIGRTTPRRFARTSLNNGGVSLGYSMDTGNMGFDASVDWLYDMLGGVNYISRGPTAVAASLPAVGIIGGLSAREVGSISAEVKAHVNQFDGMGQFVSALRKTPITLLTRDVANSAGATPKAWLVGLGYTFNMMDMDTRLGVSYQGTDEAVGLLLPRTRVQGDVTMNVWKNTEVGLHVIWDQDNRASRSGGTTTTGINLVGTGRSTTTGLASLSVRFA